MLLGRKAKDVGPYPNTWRLIGGKIKNGENLEEGMRREAREEAGIELTNITEVTRDEDTVPNKDGEMTHFIFHTFSADILSNEPKPNSDIVELQWFPESDLKTLSLPPPSIKLFSKLGIL